ncbi:GerMN domain-containing protein [Streptomyces sp. CHD11]|uniref:hypothetical protein n=1 Tax=Streptomyces sp. CHD11 TaxID=2741325 RepID=UPI001BFC9741|nr:hypothetical protein [Streptomyces sp. CHD11]MBT3153594.1 GerMN domain-containing protein [Streptomyces sp. CHD11]
MTLRGRSALLVLLVVTAVAGCGITPSGPARAGDPASGIQRPGAEDRSVRLYFTGPYGIRAVSRLTDRPLGPQEALDLLLEGPTAAERERGLTSEVPDMKGQLTATAAGGVVDLRIPAAVGTGELDVAAVSQLACTAAHADVPGGRAAGEVDVRIYENLAGPPWTVRCGSAGNAVPVTE